MSTSPVFQFPRAIPVSPIWVSPSHSNSSRTHQAGFNSATKEKLASEYGDCFWSLMAEDSDDETKGASQVYITDPPSSQEKEIFQIIEQRRYKEQRHRESQDASTAMTEVDSRKRLPMMKRIANKFKSINWPFRKSDKKHTQTLPIFFIVPTQDENFLDASLSLGSEPPKSNTSDQKG